MTSKALQTFNHAILDAVELLTHFDKLNAQPPPPEIEVLKRAALVMALAALEIYFEDLLIETSDLICGGSSENHLASFFKKSMQHDLKTFHAPSTDRVRPVFIKYLGYDITEDWVWNNCDSATARSELNALARKRGDIAHRSGRPHPGQGTQHAVTRDALRKHINFIKQLVAATEASVQNRFFTQGTDNRRLSPATC
jgi:hypothetical protein